MASNSEIALVPALSLLMALAIASLAVAILLRYRAFLPKAYPGERSLHARPVTRVGGLAIVAGMAAAVPGWGAVPGVTASLGWMAILAVALIAGVSLLDDWRGVAAPLRLCIHAVSAAMFIYALPLGALAALPALFAMVWMANLFNFMDGNDGLALTAAIAGFGAYAVAAAAAGTNPLPFVAIALACMPVLAVNLPPARMFIGDVGSVTLGFMAAAFGIAGVVDGAWPAWLPLLAFSVTIADATSTLCVRMLRRERIWEAHKGHYYQRFHQMGAGHRGTLALYAVLTGSSAATAAICVVAAPRLGWFALAAWMVIIALLFAAIDYHWRRRMSTR